MKYTTKAPFYYGNAWHWIKWTHERANKYAAIYEKAQELHADVYDFGQADHFEADQFPDSR